MSDELYIKPNSVYIHPGDEKYLETLRASTRKNKKYMINVKDKWIHFGDKRYKHFKDSTPLQLYKYLDHGDLFRRMRYHARHGKSTDKTKAKYWANKYLW